MKPTGLPSSPEQQFPYGWRFVKRVLPDGSETLEQVALTLEDVLHPQEGDVIPVNTDHDADCAYLASVFRSRPLSPPVAFVSHDLLVDWGVQGIRNHSPDIAVFVGLSREPRSIGLLDLVAYGGRCELIVEVVSPSTRKNDVVEKFDHYHKAGIPIYVIIDQEQEGGPRSVRAYRRKPTHYAEIESDDRFRIDLPLLGLMIGLKDNRAVCYDLRTYEELGDYSRIAQDLQETRRQRDEAVQAHEEVEQEMGVQVEARHLAERQAADARREADRHREEAERAQNEADRQREEAENQRQEAERAQQEAEKQRKAREAADSDNVAKDALIRELEEKLRLLQAGGPANPAT